jgi:glucose-1-phosphate cytidylyltransferase
MKVVILAGGFGTRLSEETDLKPKPMVEIGGKPILWHIMKTYSYYNFNEFIILLGYKGYYIKEYFANYFLHQSDVTIDIANGDMQVHSNSSEPWKITLLDTGLNTMTGSRVKKAKNFTGNEDFLLTYGDGVANIDMEAQIKFHKKHGKILTMTSAQPEGRFGALSTENDGKVVEFTEKPKGDGSWINAGYFICKQEIFDYIGDKNDIVFEEAPLTTLAEKGELYTYRHNGFWLPMDTLRDKLKLDQMYQSNNAPWKIWS